jgi:hypothetical protein
MSEMCVKNLLSITCIIVFRQKGLAFKEVSKLLRLCKWLKWGGWVCKKFLDFGVELVRYY